MENESLEHLMVRLYSDSSLKKKVNEIVIGLDFMPYDTLFIIGIGTGNLVIEILKRNSQPPKIIIVEPFEQIYEKILGNNNFCRLLTADNLNIYTGKTLKISQIVETHREVIPIGRNRILVHPGYEQLYGNEIVRIRHELSESL